MSLFNTILNELPFSSDELSELIRTAQFRYKVYKIPKRKAGQFRTIAQPTPELKLIQRWLISNCLSKLPLHKAATAYRKDTSIYSHAVIHAKNRFLLKMDFKDFFPSINVLDIRNYLVAVAKMSDEDARLIGQLVCWRNKLNNHLCLSIGAPSSPHISNLLLYKFDQIVANFCKENKVLYSRYADDLAFSTNHKDVLSNVQKQICSIVRELEYPKLQINHKKTVSTSRAFNKTLVGLVLTPTGEISLGREKKRRLRSELYRYSLNKLNVMDVPKLRGELAFAWSVDVKFISTLIRQFGSEVFRSLDLAFSSN